MKILFVGINASYSHTCLAVRAICEFVKRELGEKTNEYGSQQEPVLETVEFTINQPVGEILRGIYERQPDMVLFSTYIWNAEITTKIIPDIKKLLPSVVIGAGGPEFGFAAELYLKKLPELDFVIKGEGEQTTLEIVEGKDFNSIKGLYFRDCGDTDESVIFTGERELICDLSELPFPYPELQELPTDSGASSINKNKIWYKHYYNKNRHRQLLEDSGSLKNPRLDFGHSEYEVFSCDVDSLEPEKTIVENQRYEKLVRYPLH